MLNRSDSEQQAERYRRDLAFMAQAPRTPGSEHHSAVRKLCAERLGELGYRVELQSFNGGVNVIAYKDGSKHPQQKIMLSAHYDTVPNCNGADDNASGVAGVLESAELLADKQFDKTLMLACWDQEENNLAGSRAFLDEHASGIEMSYVYEMIAYFSAEAGSQSIPAGFDKVFPEQVNQIKDKQFRGDFTLLVYDDLAANRMQALEAIAEQRQMTYIGLELNGLMKSLPQLADLHRSDHSSFWDAEIAAMMITDTADFRNPNYHCFKGEDKLETINIEFALKTVNVITDLIEHELNRSE